jgi:hypothetical protein
MNQTTKVLNRISQTRNLESKSSTQVLVSVEAMCRVKSSYQYRKCCLTANNANAFWGDRVTIVVSVVVCVAVFIFEFQTQDMCSKYR